MDVSVVIPVFNGGSLVLGSVRSAIAALEHRGIEFEILITDDHSTDPETVDALRECPAIHPSVRVATNRFIKGAAGARNTSIEVATGTWIAFLDADDEWINGGAGVLWEQAQLHPGADWILADLDEEWHDGSRRERVMMDHKEFQLARRARDAGEPVLEQLPTEDFLLQDPRHVTSLIKSPLVKQVQGFDAEIFTGHDRDFWWRVALLAPTVLFVPESIYVYRRRAGSLTMMAQSIRTQNNAHSFRKLVRATRGGAMHGLAKRQLLDKLSYLSRLYREEGQFGKAALASMERLLRDPVSGEEWRALAGCLLRRG